jgi:hypothetical protein
LKQRHKKKTSLEKGELKEITEADILAGEFIAEPEPNK